MMSLPYKVYHIIETYKKLVALLQNGIAHSTAIPRDAKRNAQLLCKVSEALSIARKVSRVGHKHGIGVQLSKGS